MTIRTEERAELREYLSTAAGIAWDGCHKIYVLMDNEQIEQMRGFGVIFIAVAESSHLFNLFIIH